MLLKETEQANERNLNITSISVGDHHTEATKIVIIEKHSYK